MDQDHREWLEELGRNGKPGRNTNQTPRTERDSTNEQIAARSPERDDNDLLD